LLAAADQLHAAAVLSRAAPALFALLDECPPDAIDAVGALADAAGARLSPGFRCFWRPIAGWVGDPLLAERAFRALAAVACGDFGMADALVALFGCVGVRIRLEAVARLRAAADAFEPLFAVVEEAIEAVRECVCESLFVCLPLFAAADRQIELVLPAVACGIGDGDQGTARAALECALAVLARAADVRGVFEVWGEALAVATFSSLLDTLRCASFRGQRRLLRFMIDAGNAVSFSVEACFATALASLGVQAEAAGVFLREFGSAGDDRETVKSAIADLRLATRGLS
jgi:hypothetical protein